MALNAAAETLVTGRMQVNAREASNVKVVLMRSISIVFGFDHPLGGDESFHTPPRNLRDFRSSYPSRANESNKEDLIPLHVNPVSPNFPSFPGDHAEETAVFLDGVAVSHAGEIIA